MDINEARRLALDLMTQHSVGGWALKFDRARGRLGMTSYRTRTISLSRVLTELNPVEQIRNTILHEIAHVLVGGYHGHDSTWKAKALSIGCTGEKTTDPVIKAPMPFRVTCGHCGYSWGVTRRPKVLDRWHKPCGQVAKNLLAVTKEA